MCLLLAFCSKSRGQTISGTGVQTIKDGISQISKATRDGIQERKDKFMDAAGNMYDIVRDAAGVATNFVRDKAGAVYDVTQMAGKFLYESMENYPEEMRQSTVESMNSLAETAQDVNEAMQKIGSAARKAIPELPAVNQMLKPKAWLQKVALNNLYFQDYMSTVEEEFQLLSEGLSAKYCKEARFYPSEKKMGELVFPGGFKVKLSTKKCDVVYSHTNGTRVNCTNPEFSFEKYQGHWISKHHTPIRFTSKECKFEKKHGEENAIVLAEFDGHDTFDLSSAMQTVERSIVSAFEEARNVSREVENFMGLLPQLADVEANALDLLTSGLPEVET